MDDATMWWLIVAAVLIFIDYITGIIKALINKNLSSEAMRIGLWHKFAYVLVVALAFFLQYASAHVDLGYHVPIVPVVAAGIILIELTSILENLTEINPELKGAKFMSIFNTTTKTDTVIDPTPKVVSTTTPSLTDPANSTETAK